MAFSKSFRVSSMGGRIFFCCVNFCGVMSLPPAEPLFKSPLATGLYAFVFGLTSIGGGGGGGGGATEFDAICFGDSCNKRDYQVNEPVNEMAFNFDCVRLFMMEKHTKCITCSGIGGGGGKSLIAFICCVI